MDGLSVSHLAHQHDPKPVYIGSTVQFHEARAVCAYMQAIRAVFLFFQEQNIMPATVAAESAVYKTQPRRQHFCRFRVTYLLVSRYRLKQS